MYLKSLFGLVSSGHIREACQLARKHRDLRLNLLLAQCTGGSVVFRELLKKQLALWNTKGATDFILAERLRIYALLAGLVVWETEKLTLSSCDDVEWQRNLAVHLWSVCRLVSVCLSLCYVCLCLHISLSVSVKVCVYLHLTYIFLGIAVILLLLLQMH